MTDIVSINKVIDDNYISHNEEHLNAYLSNYIRYEDITQSVTISSNGNKYTSYVFSVPDGYGLLASYIKGNGYYSELYSTIINTNPNTNEVVISTHNFASSEITCNIIVRSIYVRDS